MWPAETGHVSYDVDGNDVPWRSPREQEPVWRPPVDKPEMPDALLEATRTEVLGADEFQRIPQPVNYDEYKV